MMKRTALIAILTVGLGLIACGGDDGQPTGEGSQPQMSSPRISVVSPQLLAVGDSMEVVGANFIGPQHGKTRLKFQGQFIDDQGQEHPFEREVEATFHDSNRLSWQMWPDIVFHPDGNRLGYFLGEVTVINEGLDGSRRASAGYRVKLDIEPSLLIRALRPAGSSCPMVVHATHENLPLAVAVEALGFSPGSEGAPLEFTWTFGLEHLDVKPDNYGTWDIEVASQAPEGTVTVTDNVTSGTVSGLQDGSGCGSTFSPDEGRSSISAFLDGLCRESNTGQKQFVFQFLDDIRSVPGLKVLRTRALAPEDLRGQAQAPITVTVRDGQGRSGRLVLNLDIFKPIAVIRDAAKDRVIHRDQLVNLQDGVSIGNLPTQVSFRDSHSEQKTIDNGHNLSPSGWAQLGFVRGVNLSWAFGVDQRQGRSSSDDKGLDVTQDVPPGFCTTYYRQAEQVRKYAKLISHRKCGEVDDAGELYIDDWQWQRELSTSTGACPATSSQLRPPGPCYGDCDVIKVASR